MKRILAIFWLVIVCFSMISSVSAANVCGNISGNAGATKTFTINTGSRFFGDKVKFTQTKGTYKYNTLLSRGKMKTDYMYYKVFYRIKGTSSWEMKAWKGKKNLTLSLKKNKEYEVQVVPYSSIDMGFQVGKTITEWTKLSTWSITSTKGINYCN